MVHTRFCVTNPWEHVLGSAVELASSGRDAPSKLEHIQSASCGNGLQNSVDRSAHAKCSFLAIVGGVHSGAGLLLSERRMRTTTLQTMVSGNPLLDDEPADKGRTIWSPLAIPTSPNTRATMSKSCGFQESVDRAFQ